MNSTPKPASRMQHLLTGVTAVAHKLSHASKSTSARKAIVASQPTSKPRGSDSSTSLATPSSAPCVSTAAVERSSCAAANLAVSRTAVEPAATCSLMRRSVRGVLRDQDGAGTVLAALGQLPTLRQPTESGQAVSKTVCKTIGKNGSAAGNVGKRCTATQVKPQAAKQALPRATKLTQVKKSVERQAQTVVRRSSRIATADAAAKLKPSWNKYTKAS